MSTEINKKVFLDFDGVLFNTVKEAYAVSMITFGRAECIEDIDFLSDHYKRFELLRCLIGPASDYLDLMPIVNDLDLPFSEAMSAFLEKKNSRSTSEKKKFQERFFSKREFLREFQFEEWLNLNESYDFFSKIKLMMNSEPDLFVVVTTKDGDTVKKVLEINKICNAISIFDAQSFEDFGSKSRIIEDYMATNNITRGFFIDDSIPHLESCKSIAGLECVHAGWGYLLPNKVGQDCEAVIDLLTKFLEL